jgi:uncharacterized membrane protein
MDSNQPSVQQSPKSSNWVGYVFALLGITGFFDSGYLAIKHYSGDSIACSIFKGCDIVTTSVYSEIWGIPVALIGVVYYLTILILSIIFLDTDKIKYLFLASRLTVVGFIASAVFVYLQLFVIKALCLYCLISATTSSILFVLGILLLKKHEMGIIDFGIEDKKTLE